MSTIKSKRLAIYYSYPSSVNATYTVAGAINVFKEYQLLVLGAGLEDISHPDHANTVAIIAGLPANTMVFGYVDAVLPLANFKTKVDNWKLMNVAGIFCDRFGYDFGLTRVGQNDEVDYIHSKSLVAFVNAWNADDACAPTIDTVTHLNNKDWILAESYQIINDNYEDLAEWKLRSEKLMGYQHSIGINVAGITTTLTGVFDQNKFDYAYFSAIMYGFDAFGWGEQDFSAITAQLPYRQRKKYFGNLYVSDVENKDGVFVRNTNVGFKVNTVTRTVDYVLN